MDGRLFEAASTGNVDYLLQILQEDPHILNAVALTSSETPLHVASIAGHLHFVKKMVKLKPDFACKLNQNGLCPIHMASANGHLEIVKELLNLNPNQARLLGKDRTTSLHYAASNGRIEVIEELISRCPDCVEEETIRGETALHLAVKNKQFEALRMIIEMLRFKKKSNMAEILNWKDKEEGNTILHFSTSSKQLDVVKLLLCEDSSIARVVEVNALNESGLTALDLLLLCPSEAGDRGIMEILRHTGAKRGRENQVSPSNQLSIISTTTTTTNNDNPTIPKSFWSRIRTHMHIFMGLKTHNLSDKAQEGLLVVAALIAAATYQAVLSPPGGLWQEDVAADTSTTTTSALAPAPAPASARIRCEGYEAGKAILACNSRVLFAFFIFSNSITFFISINVIWLLISGYSFALELLFCTLGLMITFSCSAYAISPKDSIKLAPMLVFWVITTFSTAAVQYYWRRKKRAGSVAAGTTNNVGS